MVIFVDVCESGKTFVTERDSSSTCVLYYFYIFSARVPIKIHNKRGKNHRLFLSRRDTTTIGFNLYFEQSGIIKTEF